MAQWQNWQMRRPAKADPLVRDLGSGPSCVVEPVAEWSIAAVRKTVISPVRIRSGSYEKQTFWIYNICKGLFYFCCVGLFERSL